MSSKVKYCSPAIFCQLVMIMVASLLTMSLNAQDTDKYIVSDTVYNDRIEPPPREQSVDEGVTIPGGTYFQPNSPHQPVQQRPLPAPLVKKWQNDKDFWYANSDLKKDKDGQIDFESQNGKQVKRSNKENAINERKQNRSNENTYTEQKTYTPVEQNSWFQTFLWIIIVVAFGIVLALYLANSNVSLFRKKVTKINANEEEELSTEDIFAINYQKEIDKAAAAGNYRLAIRLMFLRVLRNMADKNIIRYKQDKTNLDYLMELHPTSYYKNFFRITRSYEYSWYGLFPVPENAYHLIRQDFDQFEKEVGQA